MYTLGGNRRRAQAAAMALALAATLGAAACGGSAESQDRAAPTTPAEIKAQIREDLPRIQEGLLAGDGAAVCERLSQAAQIEVVTSGIGRITDCGEVVEWIAERAPHQILDKSPSKVQTVVLRGHEANAIAAGANGSQRFVTFAKERDGHWKLASLVALAPEALEAVPLGPGHDFSDPRDVSEEERVAEVVYDIQGDFPRGLGHSVCHELTPAGRREIERSAVGSGSCFDRIPTIASRAFAAGIEPRSSEVVSVKVNGRHATATLRDPGEPPRQIDFVLGSPDWKLPSLTDVVPLDDILQP